MWQPGDRAWYRYQIGGDREQVEFTTPVLILKTTTGKAYFVVFNRTTRRVITQYTRIENVKARSVSDKRDADLEAYYVSRTAHPAAAERGEANDERL